MLKRILQAERFRRGRKWVRRVLVKWKDFAEPNCEDRKNLEDVEALDRFEQTFGTGDGVGESEGARPGNFKNNKFDLNEKKKIYLKRGGYVKGTARCGSNGLPYCGPLLFINYITRQSIIEQGSLRVL